MCLSRFSSWFIPFCLLAITGCTRLPAREFTAYRQSFAAARTAGEQVLLDYSAALREAEVVRAEQERAAAMEAGELTDPDRPKWSRAAALRETDGLDPVGLRMQAWAVVAAYNDALSALAQGKSAAELGSEFDALAGSLQTFPWELLGSKAARIASSAGGAVGPVVSLVEDLVVAAKREADRRRFLAAIEAGNPLIHGLLDLLGEDADDFWSSRYGLYDRAYTKIILRRMGTLARSAAEIVHAAGRPGEDTGEENAIKTINAALGRVREYRDSSLRIQPPTQPGEGYAPERLRELAAISVNIAQLADQAAALDAQLSAYQNALTEYVQMLSKLDASLRDLQSAAATAGPELPNTAELAALVVRARRAMAEYERAR